MGSRSAVHGGAAPAAPLGRRVRRSAAALLRLEYASFGLATAAIGAHILIDAFVALESGTAASDHIVSAVVPLGVAGLVVWVYPWLRPGFRGVAAVVFGVLALVGSGPAFVHAAAVGPRGDDWSGFFLVPAGVALCALGVRLLWRSRKPQGRRFLRRGLLTLAAALGAFWVVLPLAMAIVVTHRPREAVLPIALGRPYEQITVRTSDGLTIKGGYVASRNGAAVIIFPGSKSRTAQARMLVRHGYGVLMLDMRGYGESDGDPNMFGWGGTKDIDAGVGFLRGRADVKVGRIGGIGFSVGGEQMLEAAAGNPRLRAVVSDGAGQRSVREALLRGSRGWFSLPMDAVQTAAIAVLSGDSPPPSLEDLTPRISPRSVFLIYAEHGAGGEDLQPKYYEAAKQPKTIWQVSEAGHTDGFEARPAEYERRVVAFFDEALLKKE